MQKTAFFRSCIQCQWNAQLGKFQILIEIEIEIVYMYQYAYAYTWFNFIKYYVFYRLFNLVMPLSIIIYGWRCGFSW